MWEFTVVKKWKENSKESIHPNSTGMIYKARSIVWQCYGTPFRGVSFFCIPRQGLSGVARKGAGDGMPVARRRRKEPPQPEAAPHGTRGLPGKARQAAPKKKEGIALFLVNPPGLEPGTPTLKVLCSTN